MLDLTRLNAHSRQFAILLFRAWPEWLRHARYDPCEEFEKEALLVEVPRPVDGSAQGLYITTSEWEISVGYGESFHTRFGSDGDCDARCFYDRAMRFLEEFVSERIVVAVASEGCAGLGAWSIDLEREPLAELEVAPGEIVRIRSWLGSHDCELVGRTAPPSDPVP